MISLRKTIKYARLFASQRQEKQGHYKIQCNGIQQVTYFKKAHNYLCVRSKRSAISALQTYHGLKNDNKITTCVRLQINYSII